MSKSAQVSNRSFCFSMNVVLHVVFSHWHARFCYADVDLPLPDVQLSPAHSADPSPSPEAPGPSTSSVSKHHRAHRSGGARDERYRSGTEHIQNMFKP